MKKKFEMLAETTTLRNFYKYKRKLGAIFKPITIQQIKLCTARSENNVIKLKILFFGTDNFSLPSLQELHKKIDGPVLGAVTSFKSPANNVRTYAEQQKIPLFRWPVSPEICSKYDLGVVVSYGHLIPENIIKAFPLGMINVHASLLPRWRGAAPIIYALMHGDKQTGISIMRIEPKHFDVGDILAQKIVTIEPNTFMPDLHARLACDGAALLSKVLAEYPASFQKAIKQNNAKATLAPKITPTITELRWSDMSASEVFNRFRALYNFKYLCTRFQGKTIQIVELCMPSDPTKPSSSHDNAKIPGSFFYKRDKKCLCVCCAAQTYIEVHQLRIQGNRVMSAMDFNNGFLKKIGAQELKFSDQLK